jgi:hypothetical protein
MRRCRAPPRSRGHGGAQPDLSLWFASGNRYGGQVLVLREDRKGLQQDGDPETPIDEMESKESSTSLRLRATKGIPGGSPEAGGYDSLGPCHLLAICPTLSASVSYTDAVVMAVAYEYRTQKIFGFDEASFLRRDRNPRARCWRRRAAAADGASIGGPLRQRGRPSCD